MLANVAHLSSPIWRAARAGCASEVEDALWELVAAGLVTARRFREPARADRSKRRRGEGRGRTRAPAPRGGAGHCAAERPGRPRARSFRRSVDSALGSPDSRSAGPRGDGAFLARSAPGPRRKEAQGELRGGRFVAGFSGEQFAAPKRWICCGCAESDTHPEDSVQIANADPLNLAGIVLPGPRVNSLTSGTRPLHAGVLGTAPAEAISL